MGASSATCLSAAPCCQDQRMEQTPQGADGASRASAWSEEAVRRPAPAFKTVAATPFDSVGARAQQPHSFGGGEGLQHAGSASQPIAAHEGAPVAATAAQHLPTEPVAQPVTAQSAPPTQYKGVGIGRLGLSRHAAQHAPIGCGSGGGGGGAELSMFLKRAASDIIGVNLDIVDRMSLVVVSILPGAVTAWNDAHPGTTVLQINDRIVAANGVRGDAQQLLTELKRSVEWKLAVLRPLELHVSLDRAGLVARGQDLKYAASSTSLLIGEIEGAFLQWNRQTKGPKISKFDRIIEINGVRGSAHDLLASASFDRDVIHAVILHYGP